MARVETWRMTFVVDGWDCESERTTYPVISPDLPLGFASYYLLRNSTKPVNRLVNHRLVNQASSPIDAFDSWFSH